MAKLDFKPKPDWNANIFALPNSFENYINESHEKLLDLEMNQKPISVSYAYVHSTCSALPYSPAFLETDSHVCQVSISNSGVRSLKTAIETDLPCACKAPNGTPEHSPLYLNKGFSWGPHHCWSPFKRYAKERKLLMASGCSNLSRPHQ